MAETKDSAASSQEPASGEAKAGKDAPGPGAEGSQASLKGLLGRKLGTSAVYRDNGARVAVTLIEAGPCTIVDSRSMEKNGYAAVQIGYGAKKMNRVNKPLQGHFKKAGGGAFFFLREFRVKNPEEFTPGQTLTVSVFQPGDRVDVIGTTKGKGFQGGMKRHGWSGGKASHGSMFHRAPGSIGGSAWPARVFRGQKMPGHMGHARRTVQNLEVLQVRPEENLLVVRGAVPGPRYGYVEIREGRDARTAP